MHKPILFNTMMVNAILSGEKTVTRRLVKPRYKDNEHGYTVCRKDLDNSVAFIAYTDKDGAPTRDMEPPYYAGDILYVRETWARIPGASSEGGYAYKYKASNEGEYWNRAKGFKWRPSIHMPKEAARIWLKATNISVERLQDISKEQIFKEGCGSGSGIDPNDYAAEEWYQANGLGDDYGRASFAGLWESTVKDREACGWAANPWVWVIEFKKTDDIAS